MNELLGIFQKNKTRKLSKDDKVLTNKLKFVYFVSFIFFMKLRLFISHVILSENLLNETKKIIQHEKVTYRQHTTKSFSAFAFFCDIQ